MSFKSQPGAGKACPRLLCGASMLLTTTLAHAWTSVKGPLTDDVHQAAIDHVLASLSAADRKILDDQQTLVDKDQEPIKSAEHAMTGIDKVGETIAAQKPAYISLCEALLKTELTNAMNARKMRDPATALPSLGKAIHIFEDATSPAHQGFQEWSYDYGIWEMASHVFKERVYPTDDAAHLYRSHLEGAVQYAYDIYTEAVPLPPRFFDPTSGVLLLPEKYLNARR